MMYETDYLAHHGIKGQKWGVRRFQDENGNLTAAGKDRYGGDGRSIGGLPKNKIQLATAKLLGKASPKKENLSEMSDQELQDRINRMKKEKEYKQLADELSGKTKNQNNNQNNDNRGGGQGKGNGKKKSVLNTIFIATATKALTDVVKKQYAAKLDQIIAESAKQKAAEAARKASREAANSFRKAEASFASVALEAIFKSRKHVSLADLDLKHSED